MSIRSWLRSTFTRSAVRTIRKASRWPRLAVELLEDRCCPSTITVLDIGDDAGALTSTGPDTYTAPTLRAAIDGANAMAGADTIKFDTSGVFSTAQTITLGGTELTLTDTTGTTTITGPGADLLSISGNHASPVFFIASGAPAELSELTITGGSYTGGAIHGTDGGGGMLNLGSLTLTGCILSDNSSTGAGGAMATRNSATLIDCIVSCNSATVGGGVWETTGSLTVTDSMFVNNTASQGGALFARSSCTLTGCTVRGNTAVSGGGLTLNSRPTLTDCTIEGNSAGTGGGLITQGIVTLTGCTIRNNTAADGGGLVNTNTVTLTNCTVSGNSATAGNGGGLENRNLTANSDTMTLINCTVAGNTATGFGGGLANTATPGTCAVTVTNCTISGNTAVAGGGLYNLLYNPSGVTETILGNTIVAGNTAANEPDVLNDFISQGNNLIGNTAGSSGWVGTDLTDAAASPLNLGPLADNGGPTYTMKLLPGSRAIDAGNDLLAVDAQGNPLPTDQRGSARISGAAVDIGAFEVQSIAITTTTTVAPSLAAPVYGQSLTFTATVTGGTTPAGSVQFTLDGSAFGSPVPLDASGHATSGGISTLDATGHTIAATYLPAGTFLTSDSGPTTFSIARAPSSVAVTATTFTFNNATQTHGAYLVSGVGTGITQTVTWSYVGDQVNAGTYTATATYAGDANHLGSSASATMTITPVAETIRGDVFILNSTASGALTVSGNAQLNVAGTLQVDSSSASAVKLSGNADINAAQTRIVGGAQATGNAHFLHAVTTGAAYVANPLAVVAGQTGTSTALVNVSGNQTVTLNPGVYASITVSGNAHLILNPGIYVIGTGGVTVSGNATVTGGTAAAGVLLYSNGALSVSGNAGVNLTAFSTGDYAGLAIFQALTDASPVTISGNANLNLNGSFLYDANGQSMVTISGNAQIEAFLVVNELTISGNADDTAP